MKSTQTLKLSYSLEVFFRMLELLINLFDLEFDLEIPNQFSWTVWETLKRSQNVLFIWKLPVNEIWSVPKSKSKRDIVLVKGSKMLRLVDEYKTIFLWRKSWKFQKNFLSILELIVNLFWKLETFQKKASHIGFTCQYVFSLPKA